MSQEKSKLHWHSIVLVVYLVIWGAWSLVGIALALHNAPLFMKLGLIDYYLFLSVPILILLSASLLYNRSKYTIIPFLLLPFSFYLTALKLYPDQLSLTYRSIDIHYFSSIPWPYLLGIVFFSICCIYYAFLRKHGHLI